MGAFRAEILSSESPLIAAAQVFIAAPAAEIFSILADPRQHQRFDGSGTISYLVKGPDRLFLGAVFGMQMRIKLPYRIKNTVVKFEENKVIAWAHLMKWQWSYELTPTTDGKTLVVERFDASQVPAFSKWWLRRTGAMKHTPQWIAKSLVTLKQISEKSL